jgi:tRNA threonylcarbamoyladenosine biosynthesis protein TsaE
MAENPAICRKETMNSIDLTLADASSSEALGAALARALPRNGEGAVLYLQGELGAGKTTCARSLLTTLGVSGPVRSPTYTLVDTYPLAELNCVHADLYRLQSAAEVDELGLRELTGDKCLMLIEWPEKGGAALPPADVRLALEYLGDARKARLTSHTPLGAAWIANLARDNSLTAYVSNLT